MSPTPEQLERRGLPEQQQPKILRIDEAEWKIDVVKLFCLNRAIYSTFRKCSEMCADNIPGEREQSVRPTGIFLDNRGEITSLHPIIEFGTEPGKIWNKNYVMAGKNFERGILLQRKNRSFEIKYSEMETENVQTCMGWLCLSNGRLCLSHLSTVREVIGMNKGICFFDWCESNISAMFHQYYFEANNSSAVREAVVVALANAAGIKPGDESNEKFPLLLEQLRIIEGAKVKQG